MPKQSKPKQPAPEGLAQLNPSLGVLLFTDGSSWYKDGSGGWAWLAIDALENEAWESGGAGGTTNNRMEMEAWIQGLVTLAQLGPLFVVVCSDSEYVGLGAMDRSRTRGKNQDLWKRLDAAIDMHTYVIFEHVRGHVGDVFNERVDKLAGAARQAWRSGR